MPFVAAFAVLKGLLIVPVGTMGPFWPGDSPLQAVRGGGGGGGGGKGGGVAEGRESSGDALLVVSILDVLYDGTWG